MILDMNVLLGRWPFAPLGYEGVDDMLRLMDRAGIERAVITSLNSIFYYNAETGNHEVGAAAKAHPDRFIPFAIINPNLLRWREHLNQCVEEYGVKGIKLHPDIHKFDLLPSRWHRGDMDQVMAEARRLALPVYVQNSLFDMRHHPGYCFNWEVPIATVAQAVERYAENTFIVGGGRWFSGDLGTTATNYYIASDGIGGPFNGIGELVGKLGADRLLFSSRTPVLYTEASRDMIMQSEISDADKAAIMGGNAARLLGLSG